MREQKTGVLIRLIIFLLILLIAYCLLLLKPFWLPIVKTAMVGLLPFILAGFIAFLLHPLVMKLESIGMNRVWAILLIYILFFGGIGYGFYAGIPLVIKQAGDLNEQLPAVADQYERWTKTLEKSTSRWPVGLQQQIGERMGDFEKWLNGFLQKSVDVLSKLIDFVFLLAVIPFIAFYLLKDLDKVKRAAWYLTPKKWREQLREFLEAANVSLGGYIRGQLLVCGIIGLAATLSFWALGMPYPVLLGIMIAITNIIPYFGPLLGAVPVVAIALLTSFKLAIIAVIIIFVLQFLEGNLLSPYIVGKSLDMHPLFIIGALIVGGEAFGVIGLIIAIPVLAVLKIAIVHTRDHFIRIHQA